MAESFSDTICSAGWSESPLMSIWDLSRQQGGERADDGKYLCTQEVSCFASVPPFVRGVFVLHWRVAVRRWRVAVLL